jgi:pyruvate dehydrogenase E1 component beta subunit
MEQLGNRPPRCDTCFGGKAQVPIVIRTPEGSGTGAAAQHSQSQEAIFCHIPASSRGAFQPYDAKGLLKTAIRDNNPVIVFEQKLLYRKKGRCPRKNT